MSGVRDAARQGTGSKTKSQSVEIGKRLPAQAVGKRGMLHGHHDGWQIQQEAQQSTAQHSTA